jgi:hypothetical protein
VNQLKGQDLDLFGKFANDDWRFEMDNFVVLHTNRPMPLKGDLTPLSRFWTKASSPISLTFHGHLAPVSDCFCASVWRFVLSKNPSAGLQVPYRSEMRSSLSPLQSAAESIVISDRHSLMLLHLFG